LKDKGKDKSVKSSSAFFTQLQNESAEHARDKNKGKKGDVSKLSAASFKL